MRGFCLSLITLLTLASVACSGGKPVVMHCFAFTPVDGATQADWDAFYKATDALPSKISGVTRVWYGKLQNPLTVYNPDDAAFQQFRKGAAKAAGEFTRSRRTFAVCMEMKNEGVLKSYAEAPYHKVWTDAYAKVRVEGTTTFNMMGQ